MKDEEFYINRLDPVKAKERRIRFEKAHAQEMAMKRRSPEAKERKRLYDKEYRKRLSTIERGRENSRKYNSKPSVKEHRVLWRRVRKSATADWSLRRLYGITLQQRDALLASQSGKCAICQEQPTSPHTDHIELEGKKIVRGILCSNCNTGLGLFRDNPRLLLCAIDYLTDFQIRLDDMQHPGITDLQAKLDGAVTGRVQ